MQIAQLLRPARPTLALISGGPVHHHLARPADTLRSIVRASENSTWFGKTGMSVRALLGDLEMKKGCDLLLARGCRVHQLHYEELVRDPAAVMARVCKFLGIPYDPRMGTLQGADRSAIFSARHHAMVKGERIVSGSRAREVLSQQLKKKVDRYVVLLEKAISGETGRHIRLCRRAAPRQRFPNEPSIPWPSPFSGRGTGLWLWCIVSLPCFCSQRIAGSRDAGSRIRLMSMAARSLLECGRIEVNPASRERGRRTRGGWPICADDRGW